MSPFHFCLSAAKNLSSFQLLPAPLITDLLQLFLGLPLTGPVYLFGILFGHYIVLFVSSLESISSSTDSQSGFSIS